ncbi:MAG: hypothetical protein HJJLKODD_02106 [Phycisphaerae bacterium]|nr:hypothetical protein [Phycisphaerae bacterium]
MIDDHSNHLIYSPGFYRLKTTRYGTMLYNIHDQYVGRSLDLYGEFSEEEAAVLQRLIQPGWVVLDVGANLGAHTVMFAQRVGPGGFVLAWEPQRIVFQMLCANLALNSLMNVNALPVAAGAEVGTAFIPPINYGATGNFGGLSLEEFNQGEAVQVLTIDHLKLPRCGLIKVDVEGMELAVLQGAAETIRRLRPILYVENDRLPKSAALLAHLESLQYESYWHLPPLFNENNYFNNPENVFSRIVSCNLLCMPAERKITIEGLARVQGIEDHPHRKGSKEN